MKILHLSSERSWRGGEQQMAYLIEESLSADVECITFVRRGSAFEKWSEEKGVRCQGEAFRNSLDISTALSLKKFVSQEKPDLIHIHSGKGHDIYALSTLLGLRCKAILSRRVDFPVKSNLWAKWKYNLKSIQRIVCVSDAIKKMTQPALKKPSKAITIHSGIDIGRFTGEVKGGLLRDTYAIPENKILVGNVAALAPHKDYSTFLRAVKRCKEQGLQAAYLIIGDGPEKVFVENEIEHLGLGNDVIMTGFRDDIPDILPELDIFLISSETEGLGTSVLDAFASGVPVVATAAGGIPESVIHEKTGLLCPVKDDGGLSKEVIRLASDENLRNRLVTNAKSHLQNFTKTNMASKTLSLYGELLDV